jgi:hypothetical protein
MSWIDYLIAMVWAGGSIYLTWMGILMVVNEKYRNGTVKMWFRIESEAQGKRFRHFVKFVEGPLYMLGGLGMMALGIYLWR